MAASWYENLSADQKAVQAVLFVNKESYASSESILVTIADDSGVDVVTTSGDVYSWSEMGATKDDCAILDATLSRVDFFESSGSRSSYMGGDAFPLKAMNALFTEESPCSPVHVVEVSMQGEGIVETNSADVCESVATALGGTVDSCELQNGILEVDVHFENMFAADAAAETASNSDFVASLDSLPEGVTFSNSTAEIEVLVPISNNNPVSNSPEDDACTFNLLVLSFIQILWLFM